MRIATLVLLASIGSISGAVAQSTQQNPKGFECGFIYDKFKGGKSSEASCSYMSEKVFSTAANPFPASEHCHTEEIFSYKDFIDFQIDFVAKNVSWIERFGTASFAIPSMIDFYMRQEHITKEEATKRANTPSRDLHVDHDITHVEKVYDNIYIDEINRTRLNPPREIPAYIILFGEVGSNYSLFISETSGNAILSEYNSDNESSWVNLRFGKCRIKK